MSDKSSQGALFKQALAKETPLAIAGVVNAYSALLASKAHYKAIFLSGQGVANSSFGIPDVSVLTLANITEEAFRITSVTRTPLIADIGFGYGNLSLSLKALEQAEAAGIYVNDLTDEPDIPPTQLVGTNIMLDRVKACVDNRHSEEFQIIAGTCARATEGIDMVIARAQKYAEAGADLLVAEGLMRIDEYRKLAAAIEIPLIAHSVEFSKSPLYSMDDLSDTGVKAILYPQTAFRAMGAAALKTYQNLRLQRNQEAFLNQLQSQEQMDEVFHPCPPSQDQ